MRKAVILAVVGVLVLVIGFPGPAEASVSGSTGFQCQVKLPTWPTPNGPAVNCVGTQTGVITGTTTTNSFYLLTPVLAKFTGAAAKYSETCTNNEPLNGKANGTISSSGIQSVTPGGKASASGINFVWTRIGATATIKLTKGTISWPNGKKAVGQIGSAVAAFAPNKLGTCTTPAHNVIAQIVGVALFQS